MSSEPIVHSADERCNIIHVFMYVYTQILGELYTDREYLTKLMQDPGMYCTTVGGEGLLISSLTLSLFPTLLPPPPISHTGLVVGQGDRSIYTTVNEALGYLDARTEFWRQQKPMYARKRERELKKFRPSPTRPKPTGYPPPLQLYKPMGIA